MIARGFLLFQLKDAINLTTLIVEEYSSVGNALILTLLIIGPESKNWGGSRFRGTTQICYLYQSPNKESPNKKLDENK